jgi:hypothetical protein
MSTDVFEIRLGQNLTEISSHGEYSYYGSVFIAFEMFPNHNYPGIVKLQYNTQ